MENRPSEAGKPRVFPATLLCMPDSKSCLACRVTAPPSSGGSAPREEPGQRAERCLVNPVCSSLSQGGVPVQLWVPPIHPKHSELQHSTGQVPT